MSGKKILTIILTLLIAVTSSVVHAGDDSLWTTGVTPDALIVFDLSGSMAWNPSGSSSYYNTNSDCTGDWYSATEDWTHKQYPYRCRRIDIAKYALFKLLNDSNADSLNQVNSADMTSLGMRLGLMRFYNCSSSSSQLYYTNSGSCIKLSWPITSDAQTTTTPYANLFCNNATCSEPSNTSNNSCASPGAGGTECMVGYSASGGTPVGYALREAKRYLDAHKELDDSRTCRQKSVIIVTDGADTYTCGGDGSSTGTSQRRAPVYYAKQLAAAGYKVYVVGFGSSLTATDQRVLNWMAYFGGTRNPNTTQSITSSIPTIGTNPCSNGSDPGGSSFPISGYAFSANNPSELASALRSAISSIQEANYSFSSQASVAAARVQEENFIYEASFEPKNDAGGNKEPFWPGHLKKYAINAAGELVTPYCWDAGAKLRDTGAQYRSMWTYKGALTSFNTSNITDADLGVGTSTTSCGTLCTSVVGFYRGDSTYNLESWKLGDLFHTNPVAVKTPKLYFYDPRESGGTSFAAFRSNHVRSAASGLQLMLAGANDGQLHAFRTGSSTDCASGGDEVWSFIPPNFLQKIPPVAHNNHDNRNTLSVHNYFIDGPLQVADVWLPSMASSGISKSAADWKTLAIFSEGQGSGAYLWSSSSTCYSTSTSGFSATYSATTPYYCGLYALDVTTSALGYKWHLMPTTAQAPYLAEPWSKMQIGRVKVGDYEKWVGFVGGGYNGSACLSIDGATSTDCNTPATGSAGKGLFVVDLTDGSVLWSFTHGAVTNSSSPYMDFSAPASPLTLDLDSDGFIDTVYMGDLGGNMWRFRLCDKSKSGTSCSTSIWKGSRLFASTNIERGSGLVTASNTHKQIFAAATSTKDTSGNVWIYFGTGENNDPVWKPAAGDPDTSSTKNRLYGIKEDANFTETYTTADLTNNTAVTDSTTYNALTATTNGWYINLSTNTQTRSDGSKITSPVGEKMISDPTVYGGYIYFVTYVPDQGTSTSACGLSGDAFMYKINYITGEGASDAKYIGHGIGSSPIISMGAGSSYADVYATASGGAGTAALTQKVEQTAGTSSMTNILYWKDKRLQ